MAWLLGDTDKGSWAKEAYIFGLMEYIYVAYGLLSHCYLLLGVQV